MKKRSPVDVSRELIIDSIVLTSEVLHSIRNNLPVPIEVSVERLDSDGTVEFAAVRQGSSRLLLVYAFLAISTVLIAANL